VGQYRHIGRREFVSNAIAGAVLATAANGLHFAGRRPNVLFILADDLGYGDLSCYGRPDYRTTNLDLLARQGTRLTNAYSASCVCTPTRCAFITGRYPARLSVGLEEPLKAKRDVGGRMGLPPEHPTVASLLKGNGYHTALVGKWHLGYLPEFGPNRHGFDQFFGILSGAVDFFTHKDTSGEPDLHEDLVPVERIGYITDLLTERAVKLILKPHKRPFYLSLHYTAPHWPWEGPGDEGVSRTLKKEYAGYTAGGSLKAFAAMMKSLDDGIGKVLKALRGAKVERDTLVIFTSDNGGERFSYNWPFSGQNGELREGGLRVPAIIRWPGVIPANGESSQVAITMDWTATILAATQTRADSNYPLDGEDLLLVIKGKLPAHARTLFWRTEEQEAVRSGKWKYLKTDAKAEYLKMEAGTEYLFDLSLDQREQADFKEQHPDVLTQLKEKLQKWNSQMLPRPNRQH